MGRPRLYATPTARVAAFRQRRRLQTQTNGTHEPDTLPALAQGTPVPLVPDPAAAVLEYLEQDLRDLQGAAPDMTDRAPPTRTLLSPEHAHAILDYQLAHAEYTARTQPHQGWLPGDRSGVVVPAARRLEHARARLIALQIDPDTLEE
jgi:hypothetical protein